jgi:hypothetical protein
MLAETRQQVERAQSESAAALSHQQSDAQAKAQQMRTKARTDAREIVGEAHVAAREVLREGNDISRNLRELSVSLRNNAERLLRDVRLTHGSMTARLDQTAPGAEARERETRERASPDLDVPEFMPRDR